MLLACFDKLYIPFYFVIFFIRLLLFAALAIRANGSNSIVGLYNLLLFAFFMHICQTEPTHNVPFFLLNVIRRCSENALRVWLLLHNACVHVAGSVVGSLAERQQNEKKRRWWKFVGWQILVQRRFYGFSLDFRILWMCLVCGRHLRQAL